MCFVPPPPPPPPLLFVTTLCHNLQSKNNNAMFFLSTSIFIPLTPGHVISIDSFPVPPGLAGELFCRVLGRRHALFTLGKISILNVTCLAIDRWYCIFRPIMYKRYFTRKRVFLYILTIWFCTCLLQINKFFEWKLSGSKCSIVKAPFGEKGFQAMIVIYSLIGFYFPCLITWASFAPISHCCSRHRQWQDVMVNDRERSRERYCACAP